MRSFLGFGGFWGEKIMPQMTAIAKFGKIAVIDYMYTGIKI